MSNTNQADEIIQNIRSLRDLGKDAKDTRIFF